MRDLKLRDDFSAETRNANKDRDLAHALSRRCGNCKGVFCRSTFVAGPEDLLAQQRIDKVASLDLATACFARKNRTSVTLAQKRKLQLP